MPGLRYSDGTDSEDFLIGPNNAANAEALEKHLATIAEPAPAAAGPDPKILEAKNKIKMLLRTGTITASQVPGKMVELLGDEALSQQALSELGDDEEYLTYYNSSKQEEKYAEEQTRARDKEAQAELEAKAYRDQQGKLSGELASAFDSEIGKISGLESDLDSKILGLEGEEAELRRRLGDESDSAYQLTTGDRTALGQLSGDVARQYDVSEENLANSLVARGLGGGPSGAAQRAYTGLAGSKAEQLSGLQSAIQKDRIQLAQDTLKFKSNAIQDAINSARGYRGNLSGLKGDYANKKMGAVGMNNDSLQAALGLMSTNAGISNQDYERFLSGNSQKLQKAFGQADLDLKNKQYTSGVDQWKQSFGLEKDKFNEDTRRYNDSQNFDWGQFGAGLLTTAVGAGAGGLTGGLGKAWGKKLFE